MPDQPFDTYLKQDRPHDDDGARIDALRTTLETSLTQLRAVAVPDDTPAVDDMLTNLRAHTAKVSLIGQVKAGKTALTNALLGVSDLLPSDVNPWTSVVTSMHVNGVAPKGKRAVFRFFDNEDWDDLVSDSGRIIQIAKKAKLDSRLDELTTQIQELRERTQTRLGKNFALLLGNNHSFSEFNGDLVKRYVCLGEEDELANREGRFADLTKSADLYLDNDLFSYPVTLSDTPGVNDPFLIREAATLQNLGAADICVVVLSAQQALSAVDLGLMRILKSLRGNRLIAFVNRIDELSDPQNQIHEIQNYITDILKAQKLDGDIPIIFGSAAWADAAIVGNMDDLPEDSVNSLSALIAARQAAGGEDEHDPCNIHSLTDVSGMSALRAAISQKALTEVYRPKIADDANRARRMAERALLFMPDGDSTSTVEIDKSKIEDALSSLRLSRRSLRKSSGEHRGRSRETVKMGMVSAYMHFGKAERNKLTDCLASSGKVTEWIPDTEGLRSELNSVYDTYSKETANYFRRVGDRVASQIEDCYKSVLGQSNSVRITPPPISKPPIPLSLMRTMSIDMRASNSLEWLRRKLDKSVYLKQFDAIAKEDLLETIAETCDVTIDKYLEEVSAGILAFLDEHAQTIENLGKQDLEQHGDGADSKTSDKSEKTNRAATLTAINDALDGLEWVQSDDASAAEVKK